jgi:hypothetical protein
MNEPTLKQLLTLAYKHQGMFGSDAEFECLITLIEDGTISTFEQLDKYGDERDES